MIPGTQARRCLGLSSSPEGMHAVSSMKGYTFGVYLQPDPPTCDVIERITNLLKRQYGLSSAAAFPPHATLAGAIPISAPLDTVVNCLDRILRSARSQRIHNSGISRLGDYVIFDIDQDEYRQKNQELFDLALSVNQELQRFDDGGTGYQIERFSPESFHAHLTLASHDLRMRPDLIEEVHEFIRDLRPDFQPTYISKIVSLYRFQSPDWGSAWWEDLQWRHLRSWRLGPLPSPEAPLGINIQPSDS